MRMPPMEAGWFYSPKQILHYLLTRPTTLKPPRAKFRNPIKILRELDSHQWLMFFAGFIGWTWDSFDFFTVSMTVTEIAQDFKVSNSDVTWGMTVTLMLRSAGALIFGLVSDRYGRKWPMIINLVLFIILELSSGFCNTLPQFLGVRALYGVAMGGLFGPAAATALEDLPYDARGVLSGLFELGYGVGYLLAAAFYRALVPTTSHSWRSLFWFGAGPPVLIIAYRWWLPETNGFQVMAAEREMRLRLESEALGHGEEVHIQRAGLKAWFKESWIGIKEHWVVFVYLVFLMTGWNSISHGSQDLFPTFLKNQVNMSPTKATVVTCIGQIGAIVGGTFIGYVSTFSGRRLAMIISCIIGGALIPAYILPRDMSLVATAFFMQFFVMGAWGPMPIHLTELAPPALRSTAVGVTYQLGNLASSASSTIESKIGERFPLPPLCTKGKCVDRFDYGRVIAIFMGAVWAWMIIFTFLGPEMSESERQENAEEAERNETLRKQGMSLREIGEQMARTAWEKEHGKAADIPVSAPEREEKEMEAEHVA